LEPIISRLKQAFAPFGKLIEFVTRFKDAIFTLGSRTRHLIDTIISEVNEWRNFRENIAFRTKVVSLPAAVDHVQEFWQMITAAWSAILDLVEQIKGKFQTTGNPTQEAEEAIADIEKSGFKTILEKFPKLFKGFEKVLGFVAIVLDVVETLSASVDDLTTIVEALKAIREDVESGGPLFLKQTNKRRIETLEDGTKIKIRLGNLHQ
jgi:prophage DNA circulation protein